MKTKDAATAYISRGEIVIRVPIRNLGPALKHSLLWPRTVVVLDVKAFAKEVASELNRENDVGATPIHRLLDQACLDAIDGGAEGVEVRSPERGK